MCTGARVQVVAKNSPFHGQVGLIVPDQGWRGGWRSVMFDDGSKTRYRPSELKLVAPAPPKGTENISGSGGGGGSSSSSSKSRSSAAATGTAAVADEEEHGDESGDDEGEGDEDGEEQEQDGAEDEQQQEECSSGSNSSTRVVSNGNGVEHVPMDVATTAADETASEP
mgnify:CR=1 FL=1